MNKREYDLAFSLGWACGCSQALRAAGCQFASYPIDWLGSPGLAYSVDVVCGDFDHWLDADDLRLIDVSHDAGFCTRMYRNDRTGLGYSHEFSDFQPFAETYPKVKASYDRRVARFLEALRSSGRILAVYVEQASRACLSSSELMTAVDRLRRKCASSKVDLLYFYEDRSLAEPKIVSDADGVTVVAADYQQLEDGKVTQYLNVGTLARFLREHISVVDRRTDEERRKFESDCRRTASGRWGYDKSAFRRWLNQRAYKLYRHLERVLRRKGLIHPRRQIEFWEETWQRICERRGR